MIKIIFFLIFLFPTLLFSNDTLIKYKNQYHNLQNLDSNDFNKIKKAKIRLKFKINYPRKKVKNEKLNYFFQPIINQDNDLDFKLINSKVIFYFFKDHNNDIYFESKNLGDEDLFSLTKLLSKNLNDLNFNDENISQTIKKKDFLYYLKRKLNLDTDFVYDNFFPVFDLKSSEFSNTLETNEISVFQISRNFNESILFKVNLNNFRFEFFNFMKIRCKDNTIYTAPIVNGLSLNLCYLNKKSTSEIFYYTKNKLGINGNFNNNFELLTLNTAYKANNYLISKENKTLISNQLKSNIKNEFIIYSSEDEINYDLLIENNLNTKKYIEKNLYTSDVEYSLDSYATGLVQNNNNFSISTSSLLDTSKGFFQEIIKKNKDKIILDLDRNISLQYLIDNSQIIEMSGTNAFLVTELNISNFDIGKIVKNSFYNQFDFLELLNTTIILEEIDDSLSFEFNTSSLDKVCIEQACADFLDNYDFKKKIFPLKIFFIELLIYSIILLILIVKKISKKHLIFGLLFVNTLIFINYNLIDQVFLKAHYFSFLVGFLLFSFVILFYIFLNSLYHKIQHVIISILVISLLFLIYLGIDLLLEPIFISLFFISLFNNKYKNLFLKY